MHEGCSYTSLDCIPCWEQNDVCPVLGGSPLRKISRLIPKDHDFLERNCVPFTAFTFLSTVNEMTLLCMCSSYGAPCWLSDNTALSRLVVSRLCSARYFIYMQCFRKRAQIANLSSVKRRNVFGCSVILCYLKRAKRWCHSYSLIPKHDRDERCFLKIPNIFLFRMFHLLHLRVALRVLYETGSNTAHLKGL